MEKISADAESERSGESQARGWMRSLVGRVLGEPRLDADVNLVMRPPRRARVRLQTRPAD